MNKWGKSMGKAILTFNTCEPPLFIHGKTQEKEVSPLMYTPVRCSRCQEFGHRDTKCKTKNPRCIQCSGPHVMRDCPPDFRFVLFNCFNCGGNHTANHQMCTAWHQYKFDID